MTSPSITLVIIVQKNDLELFKQTVNGINNFLSDITSIVVYVQDSSLDNFKDISFVFPCTYIPVPFAENEIPQEMIYQMFSHLDVVTEYIMFMECGTILTKNVSSKNFFVGNKPFLLKQETSDTDRKILTYYGANDFLSAECKYDFSQVIDKRTIQPAIYYRTSLEEAEKEFSDIHGKNYSEFYVDSIYPLDKKSESFVRLLQILFGYNHIGRYSYYFDTDKYSIESLTEMLKKDPYTYCNQLKDQDNIHTVVLHKSKKKISPSIGKSKIPPSALIKIPASLEEKKTLPIVSQIKIAPPVDENKSPSLTVVYIVDKDNLNYINYHFQYFNILVTGVDDILIYIDEEDEELEKTLDYPEQIPHRLICVKNINKLKNTTLEQYLRLICYRNIKTTYLAFFDTNTVIRNTINLKNFIIRSVESRDQARPLLGYANTSIKENKKIVDAHRAAIQKMIQIIPFIDLMSTNPHIYKTSTLSDAEIFFTELHKKNYRDYCIENNASEPDKFISAYGYLGYYIWLKERYNYYITSIHTDPLLIKMNQIFGVDNMWTEHPDPTIPEIPPLTNDELLRAEQSLLVPYKAYTEDHELKFLSVTGTSIPETTYDGLINIGDEEKSGFDLDCLQKIKISNCNNPKSSLFELIQSVELHSQYQSSKMIDVNTKRNLLLRTNKIEELLHIPDIMLNQCQVLILRGPLQGSEYLDLLTKLNMIFYPISVKTNEIVYLRRDPSFTFDIPETNIKFTTSQLALLQKIGNLIEFGPSESSPKTITVHTDSDAIPQYHVISDAQYPDTFVVDVKKTSFKTYSVAVTRLDIRSGWGQTLYLQERSHPI